MMTTTQYAASNALPAASIETASRRCKTACKSYQHIAAHDILLNPSWLFDPTKIPTIDLGLFHFPAVILPLLISTVFICLKIKRHNHEPPIPHPANPGDAEKGKPTPLSTKETVKETLTPPNIREPEVVKKYLAKALRVFHSLVTMPMIYGSGVGSQSDLPTFCYSEAVSLLILGLIVKPETWKSCCATAQGYVLFALLPSLSWPDSAQSALLGFIALLACPVAWQVDGAKGDVDYLYSGPGTLLFTRVAGQYFFGSHAAAMDWARGHAWWRRGILVMALQAGNGIMMALMNGARIPLSFFDRASWNQDGNLQAVRNGLGGILWLSSLLIAFFGPVVVGFFAISFLSSCFPWDGTILGHGLSQPRCSYISALAGFLVFLPIYFLRKWLQREDEMPEKDCGALRLLEAEMRFCGEVVGWCCTGLSLAWVIGRVVGRGR